MYLVDYDDLRVAPGLGARLAAGGGLAAVTAEFAKEDGSGVHDDVPLAHFAGVWQALGRVLPPPLGAAAAAPGVLR